MERVLEGDEALADMRKSDYMYVHEVPPRSTAASSKLPRGIGRNGEILESKIMALMEELEETSSGFGARKKQNTSRHSRPNDPSQPSSSVPPRSPSDASLVDDDEVEGNLNGSTLVDGTTNTTTNKTNSSGRIDGNGLVSILKNFAECGDNDYLVCGMDGGTADNDGALPYDRRRHSLLLDSRPRSACPTSPDRTLTSRVSFSDDRLVVVHEVPRMSAKEKSRSFYSAREMHTIRQDALDDGTDRYSDDRNTTEKVTAPTTTSPEDTRAPGIQEQYSEAAPATETEFEHESTTKEDDARDESIHELNTINDDGNVALRTEKIANDPADKNGGYVERRSSIGSEYSENNFATGVLLELEMNEVFPKAAEKFDALDEDSQLQFVNSHNFQPISRMSSGREKQVAFYNAFLHLVSASTLNAVEEISSYDVATCSAGSATMESTEMGELAAKKAVVKIIEADIIEQLENDKHEEISSLHSIVTDDNLSQFGIEIPYEQKQALQKSKSPFHFDFSKYVHAVKKARAHSSARRATVATRKDHEHAAERVRSSTDEENAPTEKITDIIEAKPTDDITYIDDTAALNGEREGDAITRILDYCGMSCVVEGFFDDLVENMLCVGEEEKARGECGQTESDHNPASKCQAKKETKKKEGKKKKKKRRKKKKEKHQTNEEANEKKTGNTEAEDICKEAFQPREKEEAVVPEKEAEEICVRIIKERVKLKKNMELARKKATQKHLQQSRLQSTKAPNAGSTSGAAMQPSSNRKANKKVAAGKNTSRTGTKVPPSKERPDQGGAVRNLSSNNRSSPAGPATSRTRTGAQKKYRFTTGLKKTSRLVKSPE